MGLREAREYSYLLTKSFFPPLKFSKNYQILSLPKELEGPVFVLREISP